MSAILLCYTWSIASYGADNWTLRSVDQRSLDNSEMWCWRRMEKISWAYRVKKEEIRVLKKDKKERNIIPTIK
jgi:hypothetical protein